MKTKTTKRINKSAWILKQAKKLSAKEIVAKAKAEGISLTPAYVYVARNNAKNAAAKLGRPGKDAHAKTLTSKKRQWHLLDSMQSEFMALVMRMGTDEAQRLLTSAPTIVRPKAKAAAPVVKPVIKLNHVATNSVGLA
jgi:hypothetical protein